MSPILKLYMVLLPLVLGSALIEGLWISRTRAKGYNWKEWATSLADVAVRRLLAFAPFGILAPVYFWAYGHRLFTLSVDSVGGVLLLFVSLEFSYYWFHRASHTMRWSGTAIRSITRPAASPWRRPIGWAGSASSPAPPSSSRR